MIAINNEEMPRYFQPKFLFLKNLRIHGFALCGKLVNFMGLSLSQVALGLWGFGALGLDLSSQR